MQDTIKRLLYFSTTFSFPVQATPAISTGRMLRIMALTTDHFLPSAV